MAHQKNKERNEVAKLPISPKAPSTGRPLPDSEWKTPQQIAGESALKKLLDK